MNHNNKCIFDVPYYGPCGAPGFPFCAEHSKVKCANKGCNNQAVAGCAHSGQFVCGYPYCAECGQHFHDAKKLNAHTAARHRKRLMTFATQEPEVFTFMDGNAWCAVRGDFINVQESNCGFGATKLEAITELLASEAKH